MRVRLGTRGSLLARWQAEFVAQQLQRLQPNLQVEIVAIRTAADDDPQRPFSQFSATGVFVKELEHALLQDTIDLAVHSMKDVPLDIPPALMIAAYLERHDARDVLISTGKRTVAQLPPGARVGTSSLRRKGQLLVHRKDLQVQSVRGNIDTRLRKLDAGDYDALILAAAGLERLGLTNRVSEYLQPTWMLPEPGQGALGLELRCADGELAAWCREGLDHLPTRACVLAERAFLAGLGGGCHLPIAAYAQPAGDRLHLAGAVVAPDGSAQLREEGQAPLAEAEALGARLAQQALARGAKGLLSA